MFRVPEESFDFLGYTLGNCYSAKNGRAYIGTKPSEKRVDRLCKAYRSVDSHVRSRLRRWLSKKHQLNNSGQKGFRDQYLKQNLGLFCLAGSTNNLPWAKA